MHFTDCCSQMSTQMLLHCSLCWEKHSVLLWKLQGMKWIHHFTYTKFLLNYSMVKNMHFISYLNLFDFTCSFLARFKVHIQYPTFSLQEFTAGHLLFFNFFFRDSLPFSKQGFYILCFLIPLKICEYKTCVYNWTLFFLWQKHLIAL